MKCRGSGELLTEAPGGQHEPCPHCGSTAREPATSATVVARAVVSAEALMHS